MNTEMIRKTEEFLKRKFFESEFLKEHPVDRDYRLEHSYRVANIGKIIAEREGFDVTEMVIGCLLHDVAYCEVFGDNGWKDHGRMGALRVRSLQSWAFLRSGLKISATGSPFMSMMWPILKALRLRSRYP